MTTSVMPDILTDVLDREPIPKDKVAYLVARARLRLHNFILARLASAEDNGLDRATIARRLKISRARVSQQLGVPGNWTIDSATKLAAAIGGEIGYVWLPFRVSEQRQLDLGAKTIPAPPQQPSEAFQVPPELPAVGPDESDEHP